MKLISFLFASAISLFPLKSFAGMDPKGVAANLKVLTVLQPISNDYSSYQGFLTTLPIDGVSPMETYYWGGVSCPNSTLTSWQIEILSTLVNRYNTWIIPYYRNGQPASKRCIVGFSIMTF